MQFLTTSLYRKQALTFHKASLQGAMMLSICALSPLATANEGFSEYQAEYVISRQGSVHGKATRELSKVNEATYTLRYQSDIEWMIFSDERLEESVFSLKGDVVHPQHYRMERTGTGPDKSYTIKFDHQNKQIKSNNKDFKIAASWLDNQQDLLTYQVQLRQDLRAGKTEFDYPIIDKKGNQRHYRFRVVGEEVITLPYGNVKTIKVKRIYDNSKREAIAWFAPKHDFLLVKMYKGKENVEQFQIELEKLNLK